MSDLISRQALETRKFSEKETRGYDIGSAYREGWNDAIDAIIDNEPSAQPAQKWIPCGERLPEDVVIVTVETKTFKQKYVCEAVWIPRWSEKAEYDSWEYCSEYNEDDDEYYVLEGWYERVHNWDEYSYVGIEDDVIAWMPLPDPYKEGEEDE